MKTQEIEPGCVLIIESDEGITPVEVCGVGCGGCVFDTRPLGADCQKHACFSYQFPVDHPLHAAKGRIVWVTTNAAEAA